MNSNLIIKNNGKFFRNFIFPILFFIFLISGCSKKASVAQTKTPQRIIALSPAAAEICFAVGAGDQVVAVSEFCDYPEEVKNLPVAGGFDGKTISFEKLLSFSPDFLYLTDGMHNFLIPQLEELGIDYYLSDAASVNAVLEEIKIIGEKTGHRQQAEEIIKGVAGMCPAVGVAEKPGRNVVTEDFGAQGAFPLPEKIYWEVWNMPYMSAGKNTFINDVIEKAGGKNIFDDIEEDYPIVSEEAVIARQPEIILIPKSSGISIQDVKNRIGWEEIPAVKNNKIFVVDDNLYTRPAARIGFVIKELSEIVQGK